MVFGTASKLCVADTNRLVINPVTWTYNNISAFQSGFGLDRLNLDDPWSQMKTNGVTGANAEIIADFNPVSVGITCFGIANHNLRTAGYSGLTLGRSSDGGVATVVATYSLPANDADILFLVSDNIYRYWHVTFTGGLAGYEFEIGYMYMGLYTEMTKNPTDTSMIQTRRSNSIYVESGGAAIHVVKQRPYRSGSLEMRFQRQNRTDADFWRETDNRIYGILSPEYVEGSGSAPEGADVFWGYVDEIDMAPRTVGSIATSSQTYDTTIRMRGAV